MNVNRLAILAIAGALTAPASAHAIGIQDDEAWKYDPQTAFARADAIDARDVRLMVPDNRWPAERYAIRDAAARAHLSGRRVLVSLLAWHSHPTPAQWERFAADVAGELAPYVDAWSPMNEPTYPGMAPRLGVKCISTSAPSMGAKQAVRRVRGWRKVRRRRGTHRRIIKRRAGRTIVKFKRARGKRARWRRTTKKRARTIVYVTGWREHRECTHESMIAAYRDVWERVTPTLRALDPGAQLVTGDVYTHPIEFMRLFYADGQPPIRPDVLGTHYSSPGAMAGYVSAARGRGLALWETEWGLGQHGGDTSPAAWVRTLRDFERAGVQRTYIYDVSNATWNTRMSPAVLARVAGR